MRQLIAELSSRDRWSVFGWTFHLATGGVRLFSRADRDDPSARWGRKTLATATMGGVVALVMAVLIAAPLSMVYRSPIDISPFVSFYWLPFMYLAARFVWRRGNAALIKPAAGAWNKPITIEQVRFLPMSMPTGGHPNLNLIRHGLLIAGQHSEVQG